MTARTWWVILAVTLAAVGLQLAWQSREEGRSPIGRAQWIWADGVHRPPGDEQSSPPEPVAFLVARDLEITVEDLEQGPATLEIVADESYRVWVNGFGPGTGIYRAGAPVDRWEIGPALQAGSNRVVVEVRSERGAGGLLARVEVGERHWGTDETWSVARSWSPGLLGGWRALDAAEPTSEGGELGKPRVWGPAPTGRWALGRSAASRELPLSVSLADPVAVPSRVRHPAAREDEWIDLTAEEWVWGIPRVGPESLWDFGQVVEGIVALELAGSEDRPALLYSGEVLPDPRVDVPRIVVPVPAAGRWEAISSRRFRYLMVVGAEPAARPEVLPGRSGDPLDPAGGPTGGVFGFAPPRERTRAEEIVWRRLRGDATGPAVDQDAGSGTGSKLSTPSSRPPEKR